MILEDKKMNLKFNLADREISTELPAFIMGIVNATPDSFYASSRGGIDRALALIDEGADLLDIGGESTRPGSSYVSEEEEINRVVPLIRQIRKTSKIPISVDTRKLGVMKAAFDEGADILNDVSALLDEPLLAEFCAQKKLPVILMHKRGIPSTMQNNGGYEDVFLEVDSFLRERAGFAESSGIAKEKIILDPGIGFGKDLESNLALIKNCGRLCGGKYPVMMALSRKTCIGAITGRKEDERLWGTLAADMLAVQKGASWVRVHDVAPARDSLLVLKALS